MLNNLFSLIINILLLSNSATWLRYVCELRLIIKVTYCQKLTLQNVASYFLVIIDCSYQSWWILLNILCISECFTAGGPIVIKSTNVVLFFYGDGLWHIKCFLQVKYSLAICWEAHHYNMFLYILMNLVCS